MKVVRYYTIGNRGEEVVEMAIQTQQARQEPDIEADDGYEMTPEEAHAFFDERARAYLGMSGEEFMRVWDAGEFDNEPEQTDVTAVALLLPFGRFGR